MTFKLVTGTGGQVACGVRQIEAERVRQVHELGRTAEHDDCHTRGELAQAAAYLADPVMEEWYKGHVDWPWSDGKGYNTGPREPEIAKGSTPTLDDRIEHMVKAGALCAAEIDRLLRLKERTK